MAKVTAMTQTKAVVTLELDEVEALYVHRALLHTSPDQAMGSNPFGGGDPVWVELDDALEDAGLLA